MEQKFDINDYKAVVRCADISLMSDPCNELALHYKLRSLHQLKQIDAAKRFLIQFKIGYFDNMGEEFSLSYDDVINADWCNYKIIILNTCGLIK